MSNLLSKASGGWALADVAETRDRSKSPLEWWCLKNRMGLGSIMKKPTALITGGGQNRQKPWAKWLLVDLTWQKESKECTMAQSSESVFSSEGHSRPHNPQTPRDLTSRNRVSSSNWLVSHQASRRRLHKTGSLSKDGSLAARP